MTNRCKNLSNILKVLIIITVIILISKYRIWLTNDVHYDFNLYKQTDTDAGFFVYNALNLKNLNINSEMPLIKNRSHIWFLVLSSMSGYNINFCITFLWILAAILVYLVLIEFKVNKFLSIFMFVFVIFCPMAYASYGIYFNLYRNIIFIQLIIICLSSLILFDLSIINRSNFLITLFFGILSSIAMIFVYFVDEVGVFYILAALGYTTLFYIYYLFSIYFENWFIKIKSFKNMATIIKSCLKTLLIFLLPFIIFVTSYFGYKYFNYRIFGISVINNRTEGEIARFVSLVQKIESEDTDTYIWCSSDQLKKAEKVSKTFDEEMLNSILVFKDTFGNDKGIHGDFLAWTCIWNVKKNLSPKEQSEFFKEINEELEEAFEKGLLKTTNKIKLTKTSGYYTKEEIKEKVLTVTKSAIEDLISFKNINTFLTDSRPENTDDKEQYTSFFNLDKYPIDEKSHLNEKIFISKIYEKYNKVLYAILKFNLLISLALVLPLAFSRIKLKDKKDYFRILFLNVVSFSSICIYIMYIFSISWFNTWILSRDGFGYEPYHTYFYTGRSFAFLSMAYLFAFAAITKINIFVFKKAKIGRWKKCLVVRWRSLWN